MKRYHAKQPLSGVVVPRTGPVTRLNSLVSRPQTSIQCDLQVGDGVHVGECLARKNPAQRCLGKAYTLSEVSLAFRPLLLNELLDHRVKLIGERVPLRLLRRQGAGVNVQPFRPRLRGLLSCGRRKGCRRVVGGLLFVACCHEGRAKAPRLVKLQPSPDGVVVP